MKQPFVCKRFPHKVCFFLVTTFALLFSDLLLALELKPSELRGKSDKKNVSVLQQRYFVKTFRPEAGILTGKFLNEAYTDTTMVGFRTALFISEWVGFEIQYFDTSVKDTDDRKALNQKTYRDLQDKDKFVTPDPEVNPIHSVTDYNAIFAPFYGKLNLMDKLIVYSDLYLTTGAAQVKTDQGNFNSFTMGVGQRFYLLESLSLRIDFRDRIFTEQRAGKDSRKNALSIDFGASYFFM